MGGVELLNSAMGGGAAQLLWGVELLNWIKAASSPKHVTVIQIKIDSRAMVNSVAHDNCTPISRGLTPFCGTDHEHQDYNHTSGMWPGISPDVLCPCVYVYVYKNVQGCKTS